MKKDQSFGSKKKRDSDSSWPSAAVNGAIDIIKRKVENEVEKSNSLCDVTSAHDWLQYKTKDVEDDETLSFFYRAHTVTVLVFLVIWLIYVGVLEETTDDFTFNRNRGIAAVLFFWAFTGMTIMPDGPFVRPHPALWRLTLAMSISYLLFLIYILFQTNKDAQSLFHQIDSKLGVSLPEKSYGGSCIIYDSKNVEDPWHNVKDKIDIFIVAHFGGYFCKTLIFRDWWLTTVISVMFEFLEYSLEHQLPNFSECWWDHWILDVLICNGLGTVLGLVALRYLSMKTYNWRGLYTIPTYRGKIKRIIAQFSPHDWIEYEWKPMSSMERLIVVCICISLWLVAELNTFYLKFVLQWPPNHWINGVRLGLLMFCGAVAIRETFQAIDDPNCDRLGRQSWVVIGIVITELLICLKFAWKSTMSHGLPTHIVLWWIFGLVCVIIYATIQFVLFKPTALKTPEKEKIVHNLSPIHQAKQSTKLNSDHCDSEPTQRRKKESHESEIVGEGCKKEN